MKVGGQNHAPAAVPPGNNAGIHWMGERVGPHSLYGRFVEEIHHMHLAGFEPHLVLLVA